MNITVPFTEQELIVFKNVYLYLLQQTDTPNLFEGYTINAGVKEGDIIF